MIYLLFEMFLNLLGETGFVQYLILGVFLSCWCEGGGWGYGWFVVFGCWLVGV